MSDERTSGLLDVSNLDDDELSRLAKELFMASPFQVCRTSELEAEWEALEPDVRRIWYDAAGRRLLGVGNLQDIATRYEAGRDRRFEGVPKSGRPL